jgi:protein TonB
MNAILTPPPVVAHALVMTARRQIRRIGPLGSIILLHALFFYALQIGLLRRAVQVSPKEVFATFITSAPQSNPPQPHPAAQSTVAVVRKTTMPTPVAAAVSSAPSPLTITAAPASVDSPSEVPVTAATTAPASAAPTLPKTVSAVEYILAPQPDYPATSKRIGEEGRVLLRVLVNEDGRPERVEVQKSSGSARLDEAARQAVLRALFKPYLEDGKALAVYALVPISFQLDNF